MSLDKPRTLFGIHNFSAVNRTTGLPYGIAKVLGNAAVTGERDSIDLFGGSNPNAWDVEFGNVNNDITLTIKAFHEMFYTLAGFTVTENAAEAAGAVTTLTNKNGTLIATVGLASVDLEAGETANLKDGFYTVVVVSPTTVDVYAVTDLYFDVGTALTFQDASGKITATPLTITTDTGVSVPGLGVELTGGSGTIAMTTGDTATFEIRSVNLGNNVYTYDSDPIPVEFEAFLYSQKKVNGSYQGLHCPKCTIGTFPYAMTEKEWVSSDLILKVQYDSAVGYSKKIIDIVKSVS